MAKAWLVNSRLIAKKVKNATFYSTCPVKDWSAEAIRQCPNCKHRIDNSDVSLTWPGLPAGVKFDPSDIELVEHLAGKVGNGDSKPHVFIDEFIPTLDEDEGICYTHPENLPGIKKDGSSVHFFHRTFKAYATGHRKRRKIGNGCTSSEEHVRWHKTGKTKPVIKNGVQRGFKKIMVLYKSSHKGMKPVKTNWVMHQYHLGAEEDEREGEFVVSKVFFQSQGNQIENGDMDTRDVDGEVLVTGVCPRTPKTHTPCPPRAEEKFPHDDGDDETTTFFSRDKEIKRPQENLSNAEIGNSSAGQENPFISLTCDEVLDPLFPLEETELKHHCRKDFSRNDTLALDNESHDFHDLDSIDVDTPPDFDLADLQFGSQDSLMSWLDWL